MDAVDKNSNLMGVSRGRGLGPSGRQVEGLPEGGRECTSYLGGLGQMFWEAPTSPAGGVIIPSHLGRGGSLPLHTQWLKTYAREHPQPTYTMAKNAGLPGVSGGEGWEPRAGDPRVCRSWRRTCTSNLGGHKLMYVKSHLPGPRGGPPPCRPRPDAFKWPQARRAFEEKRRICYANDSMIEYNWCDWLIIGRAERCGKQCVNKQCGLHRLRRKPGSEPHPCRRCGKGTQGETRLCSKECGADRGQKALHRVEARAKRIYPAVMHELLRMAERQRTLPFIGLRE